MNSTLSWETFTVIIHSLNSVHRDLLRLKSVEKILFTTIYSHEHSNNTHPP